MTYARFKQSPLSHNLAPLLSNPVVLEEMEALSRRGRPAVEAIGERVKELAPELDDTGKQHVGRLVRDALAPRGWRPVRRARVAPGKLFSWGAVYGRAGDNGNRRSGAPTATGPAVEVRGDDSGATCMERAREIASGLPRSLMSVDQFLASRRELWGE